MRRPCQAEDALRDSGPRFEWQNPAYDLRLNVHLYLTYHEIISPVQCRVKLIFAVIVVINSPRTFGSDSSMIGSLAAGLYVRPPS